MLDFNQMPAHLRMIESLFSIASLFCLILAFYLWWNRRTREGFRFGQVVPPCPLIGREVLILLGVLLLIQSFIQAVGLTLVARRVLITDKQNLIFQLVSAFILYSSCFIPIHIFLKNRNRTWSDAFGFRTMSMSDTFITALVALGAILIPVGHVGALSYWIFKKLGYSTELQDIMKQFLSIEDSILRLAIVVIAVLAAPLAEEMLFRGILYPALKKRFGFVLALCITSALFAVTHRHAMTIAPLFLLAVGFTLTYEWTGNLACCMVMHSLFNFSSLMYSYFFGKYEGLGPSIIFFLCF